MRFKLTFIFITLLLFSNSVVLSQTQNVAVLTIDGIVNEGLKIISAERGEKRDWEAFRILFSPNAHISVVVHDSIGNAELRTYSLEEFIRLGMKYYEEDGFIEYELKKTVVEYNGIAHVFQGYYAKELEFEEEGINSYQLFFDGKRWWITSLIWTSNRNGIQIPEAFK